MSDQLTYDLAQQTEAQPSIFVKKDYLSIIDNMGVPTPHHKLSSTAPVSQTPTATWGGETV